jgi:hypothetical protein
MDSTSSPGYSSRSNSYDSETEHNKPLLPYAFPSEIPAKKFWFHPRRTLYKKGATWGIISLVIISIIVFQSRAGSAYTSSELPSADNASPLLTSTPDVPIQPDGSKDNHSTDSQAHALPTSSGSEQHEATTSSASEQATEQEESLKDEADAVKEASSQPVEASSEMLTAMPWLRFKQLVMQPLD